MQYSLVPKKLIPLCVQQRLQTRTTLELPYYGPAGPLQALSAQPVVMCAGLRTAGDIFSLHDDDDDDDQASTKRYVFPF